MRPLDVPRTPFCSADSAFSYTVDEDGEIVLPTAQFDSELSPRALSPPSDTRCASAGLVDASSLATSFGK